MLCSASGGSVIMMFLADRWLIRYNDLLQCCVLHCRWLFMVCSPVGMRCIFSCRVDAHLFISKQSQQTPLDEKQQATANGKTSTSVHRPLNLPITTTSCCKQNPSIQVPAGRNKLLTNYDQHWLAVKLSSYCANS